MNRVEELEYLIPKYQENYYAGATEITDLEFDALWDELKLLNPESEILKKVGKAELDGFIKIPHIVTMGSQNKAADPKEFKKWFDKTKAEVYAVSYKLDGGSVSLQYTDGKLQRIITRGNGTIGDDVTNNLIKSIGVVKDLNEKFNGAIRGEVLLPRATWKRKYADKSNCRNACVGISHRKDGEGCEDLLIIVYDAFALEKNFKTETEKMLWLQSKGFATAPYRMCRTYDEIVNYRDEVCKERDSLGYDIDGLVVKDNVTDFDDQQRTRPERQIAFKFELEVAYTKLLKVDWSENGILFVPVAVVEPVELNGTTVTRASLANPNIMKELGVKIGSVCRISKRGEIIPKIESVVTEKSNPAEEQEIEIPVRCSCGSKLINEGTRLYCPNKACPKISFHRLQKWIRTLDIKEIGDSLLRKVFDRGATEIADLYSITEEQFIAMERMGVASSKKVLACLKKKSEITLPQLIAGTDIPGIGETIIELAVAEGIDTLEKLYGTTFETFTRINGIGDITAKILVDGLVENRERIENILKTRKIKIKENKILGDKLVGKSFCFTGKLNTMKRAEAEEIVKSLGGTIKSSVKKGLSYLVTNDKSTGTVKNKNAIDLGVEIIDEAQFSELIKENA
jgi:DNA ligase (NAD+)